MVTLVILDGFGERKEKNGNAIKLQGTPNINKLLKAYPHTLLGASGEDVGLSKGQMGNSEVGHLNIGAGRVVYQDLTKINHEIETNKFFNNKVFEEAIAHAVNNNSTLHLMGLCSDGGVHSHINHLKALVQMADSLGAKSICLHLFLDGRDTFQRSGVDYVHEMENFISHMPYAGEGIKIGSLCGRVYAMDREKRYDRVEKAYNLLIGNLKQKPKDIDTAFADSYGDKVYDEFFEPTMLEDFEPIKDNDAVIFFNFRTDRARELTEAFTVEDFKEFKREKLKNLYFATMTEYDSTFKNVHVAYPPEKITDNLSSVLSKNGLKQLHITETTKYAHVTFFFNGGIEEPNKGEDRKLIDSENVISFETVPDMKAYDITTEVLEKIAENKYDFILVNLSNADMIGHTGNLDAAIKAINAVDKCAYSIALATLMAGGECIITADHGNAEEMLTKTGEKVTSHTTNPVPFILVSEKNKKAKLKKGGKLANIAPTVLKLLGIEIPTSMDNPLF